MRSKDPAIQPGRADNVSPGNYPDENTTAAGPVRKLSRQLLARLLGIAIVLLLTVLIGTLDHAFIDRRGQIIGYAILLISAAYLLYSTLSLVQGELIGTLQDIRDWAKRIRGGNFSTPLQNSNHSEYSDLVNDLNSLGENLLTFSGQMQTRVRAQTRLYEQEIRSLEILYDVLASINASHDLDDLITRFIHGIKKITDAQAAIVWLMSDSGQMQLAASTGLSDELVNCNRLAVHRCLYERAATEGTIWIEDSIRKCETIADFSFFDNEDFSMIAAPLRYRGRTLGVYNLFIERQSHSDSTEIKTLLTSIGHHLSIAIEKARLDEEMHQHLIMDERTRIAHELHDSLAHSLASLRFQVRVLDETLHQRDESTTWPQLEQIENSLDEANSELRELISHFRVRVDDRGLLASIMQLVDRFRNETGIHTFLQKEWKQERLPQEMELQILRIVQEALWNIRKHSQAKTVRVLLRNDPQGNDRILIEDDGVGIGKLVNGLPGEHVGLTIMKERASRMGGDLRIESEHGEGTRIVLSFRH